MDQPSAPERKARWKKILKVVILTLLSVIIVFVFGVAPFWLSSLLTRASTRPMDRRITTTPADLGAEYRDVSFPSTDGVRLSGWYVPAAAASSRHVTVIFAHGLFRSRQEVLHRAIDVGKQGYSVLVFDLRNHGESGKSPCSFGYLERQDVEGAIQFVRNISPPGERIVVYGVSMGAAATLLAAAESGDVAGVISDSTFLSFDDVVRTHAGLLFKYIPPLKYPLAYEFVAITDHRLNIDSDDFDMRKAVKRIRVPILFITGTDDRRMPPAISYELEKLSDNPKSEVWQVKGAAHGRAYDTNPEAYSNRVGQFLGQF